MTKHPDNAVATTNENPDNELCTDAHAPIKRRSAGGKWKTALADDSRAVGHKAAPRTQTKTEIVLRKLRSAKGVTIVQLGEATGWQAHSVRGFLSAVVRKKLALNLVSDLGKDGTRRYRVGDSTDVAPPTGKGNLTR